MNYRSEKYPKRIQDVIKKSEIILKNLKFKNAPQLKNLISDDSLSLIVPKSAGLYIFIEKSKPVYVGISRNIKRRLRQHGWGKTHNHATLAYLITEHKLNYTTKKSKLLHEQVKTTQKRLQNCRIIIIPVQDDDPYLLHFMEVYFSGCLKPKWNSFRTH